jgi:hypothetical protein
MYDHRTIDEPRQLPEVEPSELKLIEGGGNPCRVEVTKEEWEDLYRSRAFFSFCLT